MMHNLTTEKNIYDAEHLFNEHVWNFIQSTKFLKTKKGEIYKSITVDLPELFPVECTGDKTPGIMALNAEVCNKIWTKR